MDALVWIGIAFAFLIIAVPTLLMLLLFYHGERSRREELKQNKFRRRGFEVKLNPGNQPASQEERENDHG